MITHYGCVSVGTDAHRLRNWTRDVFCCLAILLGLLGCDWRVGSCRCGDKSICGVSENHAQVADHILFGASRCVNKTLLVFAQYGNCFCECYLLGVISNIRKCLKALCKHTRLCLWTKEHLSGTLLPFKQLLM